MRRVKLIGLAVLCLALLAQTVLAGAGPGISWSVFSGGGAPASAGAITLNGSLGQTAVGPATGGALSLTSGYWLTAARRWFSFLPSVVRRAP